MLTGEDKSNSCREEVECECDTDEISNEDKFATDTGVEGDVLVADAFLDKIDSEVDELKAT